MGIIKEFRLLQKDVSVLKDKSGDDIAATGSGFQTQGTAGFLASSAAGIAHLGCTAYTSNKALQNAFYAGSVRLSAGSSGAVDIAVKRGKNKLVLPSASLVEPTDTYQSSQYLSASMAWLASADSAAYAAIARSTSYAIVVPLVAGGGGGDVPSGWHEAQKQVVTSVNFTASTVGTLVLNVQTVNLKYVEWS